MSERKGIDTYLIGEILYNSSQEFHNREIDTVQSRYLAKQVMIYIDKYFTDNTLLKRIENDRK